MGAIALGGFLGKVEKSVCDLQRAFEHEKKCQLVFTRRLH